MRTFLAFALTVLGLRAEERFLLAADTRIIEVNRAGRVTEVWKSTGNVGIYDAWRLPDGGIAYAHRRGLAVLDAKQKAVMSYRVGATAKDTEANSVEILEGGKEFALMDSGACSIKVIDRSGMLLREVKLPDLAATPLHSRYRMIRKAPGEAAFWVCQYAQATSLKVEWPTGVVQASIPVAPLLKTSPTTKKLFAFLPSADGSIWATTSTGLQLLHLSSKGEKIGVWTSEELGLSCRYLLGLSRLTNGNFAMACGDYHLNRESEGRDVLCEVAPDGKIVWRLTREQLLNGLNPGVSKTAKLEELHITSVHAYNSEHLSDCLRP